MAKTAFATGNALTKKAWEEKLFRDWPKGSFFGIGLMGKPGNKNSFIHVEDEWEKNKGDRVTFGICMRLSGTGVVEGVTLEGAEEALTTYSFNLTLTELAHGVRDRGPIDRQRPAFSIDTESEAALKEWGGEKIDEKIFEALRTSPTAIFYNTNATAGSTTMAWSATAATAKAALRGTLTLDMLSWIATWAKTGNNRAQTPLKPAKIDGKDYYALVVHPDCLYDLKATTAYQTAMREAQVRGASNPLFTNANAVWHNVIVYEHENCSIGTDGGAGAQAWAHCHFLGAQAIAWGWGKRPVVEYETFDYKREHGYGMSMIYAVGKPKFNSKDYGALSLYLARTQISDSTAA